MATININVNADSQFNDAIIQGLKDAGMMLINEAKVEMTNAGLIDTGIGRNSLTHKVDERDFSCTVGSVMEYMVYLHEGTGIYARNGMGRQTSWTYRTADGKFHTTKGMRAHPFLEEAFYNNIEEVKDCFRGCLDK